MATQFRMPQLGETVVEGVITRWLKQEGEEIAVDEALVEVSTDKVDSEIPSPASGTITKIHAQEGETVTVGQVIAEIGEAGDGAQTEPAREATGPETAGAEPEEPAGARSHTPARADVSYPTPPDEPPPEFAEPAARAPSVAVDASDTEPRRGILSPLVRKLAEERGVDLTRIRGTGTGGRITKTDVMAAAGPTPDSGGVAPAAPVPATSSAHPELAQRETAEARPSFAGGDEIVQVTHMRKAIADHMVTSLRETARAWNTIEVDLSKIARLRAQAGSGFKTSEGFSLTWMPFLCKAVTQMLLRHPQLNSTWNGDGTITRKHYVNLGIAVALENGLIVPVIRHADGMNLVGLGRAVRDLADRARTKKLSPDDVQGGTFTITNPGPFGSIMSVPIINKGQAAILAIDAVVKRPLVVTDENGEDSISIRPTVYLSLSWDHRVIDGAEAAVFLRDLKEALERGDFSADVAAYLGE